MICIWAGLPAFGFSSYSWKKKCWHIVELIEICLVWLQRQLFNSLLIPALYCAVAQWWLLSTGQVNTSPVPSRQSRFYFDSRTSVINNLWLLISGPQQDHQPSLLLSVFILPSASTLHPDLFFLSFLIPPPPAALSRDRSMKGCHGIDEVLSGEG